MPKLQRGKMYHVKYNHEAGNFRKYEREFTAQYLGEDQYGRLQFSFRPLGGTSQISPDALIDVEEIRNSKPMLPKPVKKNG